MDTRAVLCLPGPVGIDALAGRAFCVCLFAVTLLLVDDRHCRATTPR